MDGHINGYGNSDLGLSYSKITFDDARVSIAESGPNDIIADLVLDNVSISLANNSNPLVHPVNVTFRKGSIHAIMGSSGSGKTTLLNVIAKRYDPDIMTVTGSIQYEGLGIGYVTQIDYLLPYLTVKETLMVMAGLVKSTREQSNEEYVDKLIMELGLKDCSDTVTKKISGGQKRRVSVGVQMISDPEIICADEPTSGLDSFTTYNLIESLLHLASSKKKVIILSIHQPSAKVFSMFDTVLMLAKGGYTAYCGKVADMIEYFANIGFACPDNANPADYFIDLISVDIKSSTTTLKNKRKFRDIIRKASQMVPNRNNYTSGRNITELYEVVHQHNSYKHYQVSWIRQYLVLVQRQYMNERRNIRGVISPLILITVLGLIVMCIYYGFDGSLESIQNRQILFYTFLNPLTYFTGNELLLRLCEEIRLFDREIQDELYSSSAYFLAYLTISFPLFTIRAFLFAIPIYFGCQLRGDAVATINLFAITIMLVIIANGISWLSISLSREQSLALFISNFQNVFINIAGGYLINNKTYPVYLAWVKKLGYHYYGYNFLISNELSDKEFTTCDGSSCTTVYGNDVLRQQGVKVNEYIELWPILIAMVVAYHLLSWILLHSIRHPPIGAANNGAQLPRWMKSLLQECRKKQSEEKSAEQSPTSHVLSEHIDILDNSNADSSSDEVEEEREEVANLFELRPSEKFGHPPKIHISVIGYTLNVHQKSTSTDHDGDNSQTNTDKVLLNDINAIIKAGRLVAIMGGSGSGKSTLLNSLSGRVNARKKKTYMSQRIHDYSQRKGEMEYSGSILYNGRELNTSEVETITGYVQQNDIFIPYLTVRETFQYSAAVRMPPTLSYADRDYCINFVAKTLGLGECMDVLVGDANLKGISGGEMRRLSIGIQLLLNPSICLLDEPTTGLDAFTARNVINSLADLAVRGRSVIISIHQPRYDIFSTFDDVILLSKGELVWAGPTDAMLEHFQALGHPCPSHSNPADFILDLSSINDSSEKLHLESKSRIADLIKACHIHQKETGLLVILYSSRGTVRDDDDKPRKPKNVHHSLSYRTWKALTTLHSRVYAKVSFLKLVWLSVRRLFRVRSRQLRSIIEDPFEMILVSFIFCLFYCPLGNNQASIQNRIGIVTNLKTPVYASLFRTLTFYLRDKRLFLREYVDNGTAPLPYLITYTLDSLPYIFVSSSVMAVTACYVINLNPTLEATGLIFYAIFIIMLYGQFVGVALCSLLDKLGIATDFTLFLLIVTSFMASTRSSPMVAPLEALNTVSPLQYSMYLMSQVAFRDKKFTCSVDEQCLFSDGNQVLKFYRYDNYGHPDLYVTRAMLAMLYIVVVLIVVSYILLKIRVRKL